MDKLKNIFWNAEESRLRAGWRIVAFVVIFVALSAGIMFGVRTIVGELKGGGHLQWGLLAITATLAVYVSRKYIDKKDMTSLGLKCDRAAFLDFLSGIVNSALIMAGLYFSMLWTGLIEYNGMSLWAAAPEADVIIETTATAVVLWALYQLTIVAWWEELVFRGVVLQNMMEGMGLIWATILSSLIFGFVHYGNPNATIVSSLLIAIITVQLIYAYVKTGQLWLPIGIHLGWNFFQAYIFGFAVSGMDTKSLISQTPVGPEWLTGGSFGAEGSILVIPFSALSMVFIHWWVRKSRAPEQKFMEFIVE